MSGQASRAAIEQAVAQVLRSARDVDDAAESIRGLAGVESVEVGDYLMKSEPPRREIVIRLRDGELVAEVAVEPSGSLVHRRQVMKVNDVDLTEACALKHSLPRRHLSLRLLLA